MVPEEVTWATMVFLLKVRVEYWGVGLVEVVWKVCTTVVNFWLKWSMTLHDTLHRFRAGRGIGTATLEGILTQQLAGIAHEPLFQVFLDMRKLYDSSDRVRFMKVLQGYGIG